MRTFTVLSWKHFYILLPYISIRNIINAENVDNYKTRKILSCIDSIYAIIKSINVCLDQYYAIEKENKMIFNAIWRLLASTVYHYKRLITKLPCPVGIHERTSMRICYLFEPIGRTPRFPRYSESRLHAWKVETITFLPLLFVVPLHLFLHPVLDSTLGISL